MHVGEGVESVREGGGGRMVGVCGERENYKLAMFDLSPGSSSCSSRKLLVPK